MNLFRPLSPEEEKQFRQWARENYKVCDPILGVWHPVVQDECLRINEETLVRHPGGCPCTLCIKRGQLRDALR